MPKALAVGILYIHVPWLIAVFKEPDAFAGGSAIHSQPDRNWFLQMLLLARPLDSTGWPFDKRKISLTYCFYMIIKVSGGSLGKLISSR